MVGTGPLFDECQALAKKLGIDHVVTFLGGQGPDVVRKELQQARCYVQHSIEAPSGDSEGTPVSVLEAGATGLPVVSTRHAGIPDVVLEGETGFLVEEHDVEGMAQQMLRLAQDPDLAGKMGRAGRARIQEFFSKEKSIDCLWDIIEACIKGRPLNATSSVAPNGNAGRAKALQS
jgi:glycosyltransferase involved in cell wall biosynthesis